MSTQGKFTEIYKSQTDGYFYSEQGARDLVRNAPTDEIVTLDSLYCFFSKHLDKMAKLQSQLSLANKEINIILTIPEQKEINKYIEDKKIKENFEKIM